MNDDDRLRTLADLVPVLEAPDADFGRWVSPPPRDGVHSLGWFAFGQLPDATAWLGMALLGACGAASAWLNVREAGAARPASPVALDTVGE